MLCAAVIDRLDSEVPDLSGRLMRAADFAGLLARNALPQVTPAAAVLPLGMRGGPVVASLATFRQVVTRRVAVVLVLRAPDQPGSRAGGDIEALAEAVLAALSGWTPDDTTPGVLRLEAAELRSLAGGTLIYDLSFALDDRAETSGD
jgi:hypothetical protein